MIEKLAITGKELQWAEIGLNQQMLPVFFGLLLVSAIAWLFLSKRLYDVLRNNYPEVYERLGSPKLFMKKSFVTNYRVLRFLFRGEYKQTDANIDRLCQGLRYIFLVYVICFLGCLLLLVNNIF